MHIIIHAQITISFFTAGSSRNPFALGGLIVFFTPESNELFKQINLTKIKKITYFANQIKET